MKRKSALIFVFIFMMTVFSQSAGAVNVIMNSSFLKFADQEPVIEDNVTLVPIRTIAEALGLEVTWDDPTDTVVLKKDGFYIELVIGSTRAKTASGVKTLSAAPKIINSRTMVPLRFIAEELGLTVTWNGEYQRVIINGKIDTDALIKLAEEANKSSSEEEAEEIPSEDESVQEEEPDFVDDTYYTTIDSSSASIIFDIPMNYYDEFTDDENSFAYRCVDAVDFQHNYDWNTVTRYESYADEQGKNGILFIVQENYEDKDNFDISDVKREYPEKPLEPERPIWPDIDFLEMYKGMEQEITRQLFVQTGVEMPENAYDMSEEELMEALGFESQEEMDECVALVGETVDFYDVPGYDGYMAYQEEMNIYFEERTVYFDEYRAYEAEYNKIADAKHYACSNFVSLYGDLSEDDWIALFNEILNTDGEVRYEEIEIVDINGKKIIHATVYAEDPDDEQGVFEFYRYPDKSKIITILGGTLFGSEPSPEVADVLSNMMIR